MIRQRGSRERTCVIEVPRAGCRRRSTHLGERERVMPNTSSHTHSAVTAPGDDGEHETNSQDEPGTGASTGPSRSVHAASNVVREQRERSRCQRDRLEVRAMLWSERRRIVPSPLSPNSSPQPSSSSTFSMHFPRPLLFTQTIGARRHKSAGNAQAISTMTASAAGIAGQARPIRRCSAGGDEFGHESSITSADTVRRRASRRAPQTCGVVDSLTSLRTHHDLDAAVLTPCWRPCRRRDRRVLHRRPSAESGLGEVHGRSLELSSSRTPAHASLDS